MTPLAALYEAERELLGELGWSGFEKVRADTHLLPRFGGVMRRFHWYGTTPEGVPGVLAQLELVVEDGEP